MANHNLYPVTRESIERAKQQQQRDRMEVFHRTGITITDDGTAIIPPAQPVRREVAHCGLCSFTAVAPSYDVATQRVINHICDTHFVHPFTAESLEQAS